MINDKSYCLPPVRNHEKRLALLSGNSLLHVIEDFSSILSGSIIVCKDDHISIFLNYFSHFRSFCSVSFSGCPKEASNTSLVLPLRHILSACLEPLQHNLKSMGRMCKVYNISHAVLLNHILSSLYMRHILQMLYRLLYG